MRSLRWQTTSFFQGVVRLSNGRNYDVKARDRYVCEVVHKQQIELKVQLGALNYTI